LDLAKNLAKRNVKLYGSGGTAALVREAGFPIRYVTQVTEKKSEGAFADGFV
jgi:AICAR transformylase/IMP cyclohydrolase PurH